MLVKVCKDLKFTFLGSLGDDKSRDVFDSPFHQCIVLVLFDKYLKATLKASLLLSPVKY